MFERYAIFYTPSGNFAQWGSAWLGWDNAAGCFHQHPDIPRFNVAEITSRPRKYGFHATLKAPFRIRPNVVEADLRAAASAFAAEHKAFAIGALELRHGHGFIGLRPKIHSAALQTFASQVVRSFDPLRAPLTEDDIARRRKARLSDRQDQQMLEWGYPFIFDDFNFHLTLTGRMQKESAAALMDILAPIIDEQVPNPVVIDAITLLGEDRDGFFHQIERFPLSGGTLV